LAIQPPIYPQIFTHLDCEGTENSADDQTIPQLFFLSPLPKGKRNGYWLLNWLMVIGYGLLVIELVNGYGL